MVSSYKEEPRIFHMLKSHINPDTFRVLIHLFKAGRCTEVVSLAQNCRRGAAPDGVIRPSIILVIHDVEVS